MVEIYHMQFILSPVLKPYPLAKYRRYHGSSCISEISPLAPYSVF